jgi:cytochrome c oxidase subunit 2
LFTQQCGSCHRLADAGTEGEVGPDLDKVLVGKDADFIHESIVNPNDEIAPGYQPDVMPKTFGESLTDAQLQSLVEYLLKTAGKS